VAELHRCGWTRFRFEFEFGEGGDDGDVVGLRWLLIASI